MKDLIISLSIVAYVAIHAHGSALFEPATYCKFYNATPTCNSADKYRTLNGFCNNLNNPKWGAEHDTYQRFMGTRYQDGVVVIKKSVANTDLPSARKLSLDLFSNQNVTSKRHTIMLPQFGQYVAEDKGSTADIFLRRLCCADNGVLDAAPRDTACMYIPIENTDPTYSRARRTCMNFLRTQTDVYSQCSNFRYNGGAVNQINTATAFLDQSGIYGNSDDDMRLLRNYTDGQLNVTLYRGKEYPPLMAPHGATTCLENSDTSKCFLGGDFRMNEIPGLAAIHVFFIREHNRLASELKRINPTWNDEKLFQEARRINIAILQYISYYQYFPETLGKWNLRKNLIIYSDKGSKKIGDYDEDTNPATAHEHANAANRFFHVMIRGDIDLISSAGVYTGVSLLKDTFFQPNFLTNGSFMDDITRGMCRGAATAPGKNMPDALKEFLFRRITTFGLDMKATDIQRGRDVGLVSYNDAREYCGLPRATAWSGFADEIPQTDIDNMRNIYGHVDDVELSVGGALERPVPDALVGKTFSCIMIKQLYVTRVGDRFWFENTEPNVGFTNKQIEEIKKSSLARIFCDNGKNISQMQRNVFRLPSDENPIVDCSLIPRLNISLWQE